MTEAEASWRLYEDLRKEIVSAQHLRAGIVTLKITFVGGAIWSILRSDESPALLAIPVFAAIAFDFLIAASTHGIRRKGKYCRESLEPKIRTDCHWQGLFWEESLVAQRDLLPLPFLANAGMTVLAAVPAVARLSASPTASNVVLLLTLTFLLICAAMVEFRADHGTNDPPVTQPIVDALCCPAGAEPA